MGKKASGRDRHFKYALFHKKKLTSTFKKTILIPGKAPSPETQETYAHLIQHFAHSADTSEGELVVVSLDPCHPIHNALPENRWQERGTKNTLRVASNTGRRRLTIVGAVNLVDHDITILSTEENCDREVIKSYCIELRKHYPHAQKIVVFLDNASYQKSVEVRAFAQERGIYFEFLPPYAPNLALIERVWKFMKKKVLRGKYYETFQKFCDAIDTFFKEWSKYKEELASLLTLNFEIIRA